MARPSDWSPVDMDRDPTPGNPDEVRDLADDLQTFADDVGEALGRIRGMAEDRAVLDWAGLSAEAFRSEFDGVPPNLQKLQTSYDMAAQALQTYWPKLETAQGMADRALDRAISAQADLSTAQAALTDAQDWVSRAGDEAERLEREGERENVEPPSEAEVRAATRDATAANEAASSAQSRVDAAEEALSAARQLALDAKEMREEAARTCASEIDAASDAGIQNRRWWEDAIHWVSENWDTIVEICKVVVAVLGIVVMIIGGPLAWVVLAAALVVLADTLYDYANGRATLWDVAFAALDCIPGMKGLTTLGGLARGMRSLATTGLRGLRQGMRGLGQTIRRMGRGGDNLVCRTDPIDMATGEMVMDAVDVELPGVLPLIIRRHHRTSLREGTWFGPSWASTLDQRLVLDDAGLQLVTADGMILDYPRPQPDEPVLPVEGPRWGLAWHEGPGGPLTIHQRETGHTLHFAPVPGRRGGELPLTAITDRNDNRVDLRYDETGAPTDVIHHGGYHLGITTHEGRITELRLLNDPDQPTLLRYGYDERGNLAQIFNSSGLPLKLSYDEKRRITGWEDRNGTWYRYTYDDEGRCVATDGTDGYLASRIVYDTDTHRTLFTDSLGHTTVYQFNDSYQLVTETDPLGHHTHRTYDRYDRPLTITDPLGRTTTYEYDDHGTIAAVTRPDGNRVRFEHNSLGLPERIHEADGAVWLQEYDEAGNRISVTDPAGAVTRYARNATGAITAVTDAVGKVTRLARDEAGQLIGISAATGGTSRYRLDAFGRVVEVIEPHGGTRLMAWSVEGKLLRHTDALGGTQTWVWDGEGNCLVHTNEVGGRTEFEYGAFDLPLVQVRPDGTRHTFQRDTELNLTRVTDDAGLMWEYGYDAAGRLVAETDYDGRRVRYERDAAGQLTSRTNALGQVISFSRDRMGRIVLKNADGRLTRYEHDPAGRLSLAVGPDAELTIERDPVGRVVAETCNGETVTYTYDAASHPRRRTTPSGVTSEWAYDEAGRPASLTAIERSLTFDYDAAGHEITRGFGPDVLLRRAWDPAGRLVKQSIFSGGVSIRERAYAYRADHYLAAVDHHLEGAGGPVQAVRFDVDAGGRVTAVNGPTGNESYVYDSTGNQVSAEWPAAHESPTAAGHREYAGTRITRAGGVRYEHDDAGRVIVRQKKRLSRKPDTWRYAWDAEGRLTEMRTPDGDRWRYLYDPLGRRIAKMRIAEDDSVIERTDFSWDGATVIEQRRAHAGTGSEIDATTWEYVGNHPVAQIEQRSLLDAPQSEIDVRFYAIVTDTVGAPTEMLDESGAIAWHNRTSLWGSRLTREDNEAETPLRFPGQYADEETGWHYNYYRHYDPEIARYTSPDPLGLAAAPNPVAYVHNPHIWSDPLGLEGYLDFFTVQSPEDAARLRGDGTPWPGEATRGQWGDGVYSWGTRGDAEAYADLLRNRRGANVEIMHFRVSEADFAAMNRADITAMPEADAEAFMDRHSRIYGDGVPHNRDYIRGFTSNFGNEHFFSSAVFCRLKFS
ncbi:DUF6531 domain-containing protein [Streptomyces millisiae]|uniref:RHS repeat-associated core domain-containing protein n=1 Tax=Streptomyces millisiae TaxID=3075542 RepID=A0ABU2LQM6_9ACTN|nr:DUF6531 domain-containing protein [Streptomyces sp. DSM 44918]MDT0319899.1 RHS repeat-associated core domain-containing protein [Streptomyces sp. DSM 44918]